MITSNCNFFFMDPAILLNLKKLCLIIFNIVYSLTSPTWQQTILILALILLFTFKVEIKNLINRINKFKYGKFEMESSLQETPKETPIEQEAKHQQKEEKCLPTIKKYIQIADDYISKQNFTTQDETIKHLKYCLADTSFILRCERVYKSIYGGQIQILNKLLVAHKVDHALINKYVEMNKTQFPEIFGSWDINKYMKYLLDSDLVKLTLENEYAITDFGKDFLNWMHRFHVTQERNH